MKKGAARSLGFSPCSCMQVRPGGEGYDKSKARFKNIKVLELPVKKEQVNAQPASVDPAEAPAGKAVLLFNGASLENWSAPGKTDEEDETLFLSEYGALSIQNERLIINRGGPQKKWAETVTRPPPTPFLFPTCQA